MTPKEKANLLVAKMYLVTTNIGLTHENSKQCAIIAIDEMIEFSMYTIPEVKESIFNYLQEVKQEIEKL